MGKHEAVATVVSARHADDEDRIRPWSYRTRENLRRNSESLARQKSMGSRKRCIKYEQFPVFLGTPI